MALSASKLKKKIEASLKQDSWKLDIEEIITDEELNPTRHIFSMLSNRDELVKWRAVSSFGILSKELCSQNFEKAREIIRRAIWALTEESGGIAWGYPELIGEILSNCPKLADEFNMMLLSYVYESEDGQDNYLDHEPFRAGAFWAIMRLAQVFPEYINKNVFMIKQRQKVESAPEIIAYLLVITSICNIPGSDAFIDKYKDDYTEVTLYLNERLVEKKLSELAKGNF